MKCWAKFKMQVHVDDDFFFFFGQHEQVITDMHTAHSNSSSFLQWQHADDVDKVKRERANKKKKKRKKEKR